MKSGMRALKEIRCAPPLFSWAVVLHQRHLTRHLLCYVLLSAMLVFHLITNTYIDHLWPALPWPLALTRLCNCSCQSDLRASPA